MIYPVRLGRSSVKLLEIFKLIRANAVHPLCVRTCCLWAVPPPLCHPTGSSISLKEGAGVFSYLSAAWTSINLDSPLPHACRFALSTTPPSWLSQERCWFPGRCLQQNRGAAQPAAGQGRAAAPLLIPTLPCHFTFPCGVGALGNAFPLEGFPTPLRKQRGSGEDIC